MYTKQAPNDLRCGCRLGPDIRYCAVAKEIRRRVEYTYRLMVSGNHDWRAGLGHRRAKSELAEHYRLNGSEELLPW